MSDKRNAPGLLDEPPLLVYPTLAQGMGINKAIVFQQLHFLLNTQKSANNEYNFVEGRWWVYNTYLKWCKKYFPWLRPSTVKQIFLELEADGIVVSVQGVKNPSNREKWYTIDYDKWDSHYQTMRQKMSIGGSDKKSTINRQKMSDLNKENPSDTSQKKEVAGAPSGEPGKPAEKVLTPAQQRAANLRAILTEYRTRSNKRPWTAESEQEALRTFDKTIQTLLCGVKNQKTDGSLSVNDYMNQESLEDIVLRAFCHQWVIEKKLSMFESWEKLFRHFHEYVQYEMADHLPGFKARFEAGTLWNKPAAPAAAPEPQDTPVHVFSDMDYLDEIGE